MRLLPLIILALFFSSYSALANEAWTPWYKLDDGALNGIEFSHKKNCKPNEKNSCTLKWRFNSNYDSTVEVDYVIAWENISGIQMKRERLKLQPGITDSSFFAVSGTALDEVSLRVIADNTTLQEARKEVAEGIRRQEQKRIADLQYAERMQLYEEKRRDQREEEDRLERQRERIEDAQRKQEEREERRQMDADNRRQQQEQDRQFKAGMQEAMKAWSGDDPISQARKQQDRNFEAQREQMRQRDDDRRREQAEERRQQLAQQEADRKEREVERNRKAEQDRRDREAKEQAERDRKQREEESRQAQQAAAEAKQKKEAAAKAEAERKRKENEGTWETGDFKVTAWGSDSLYLKSDTILAHVTNSAGEATFNGTYVKLENRYKTHSIDYSVSNSNHTNRTLKPGEKVIVPLNLPFDPKRTTEVVVRIRYWKGVNGGG